MFPLILLAAGASALPLERGFLDPPASARRGTEVGAGRQSFPDGSAVLCHVETLAKGRSSATVRSFGSRAS